MSLHHCHTSGWNWGKHKIQASKSNICAVTALIEWTLDLHKNKTSLKMQHWHLETSKGINIWDLGEKMLWWKWILSDYFVSRKIITGEAGKKLFKNSLLVRFYSIVFVVFHCWPQIWAMLCLWDFFEIKFSVCNLIVTQLKISVCCSKQVKGKTKAQ